jgi:hypothetical protein
VIILTDVAGAEEAARQYMMKVIVNHELVAISELHEAAGERPLWTTSSDVDTITRRSKGVRVWDGWRRNRRKWLLIIHTSSLARLLRTASSNAISHTSFLSNLDIHVVFSFIVAVQTPWTTEACCTDLAGIFFDPSVSEDVLFEIRGAGGDACAAGVGTRELFLLCVRVAGLADFLVGLAGGLDLLSVGLWGRKDGSRSWRRFDGVDRDLWGVNHWGLTRGEQSVFKVIQWSARFVVGIVRVKRLRVGIVGEVVHGDVAA